MQSIAKYNDNYRYVLLVIDDFSRFVSLIPIKSKNANDMLEAFESLLNTGRKPLKIRTDAGTEFTNKVVQKLFKDENIIHFISRSENKASIAERAIKTIKLRIYKYFTEKETYRYIDKLQDFAWAYNNSVHRSIGMRPIDVSRDNQADLSAKLYGIERKKKDYKFDIEDNVRVSHTRHPFRKEYYENFSGELFKIVGRDNKGEFPLYKLQDMNGEDILGSFYEQEISRVTLDTDKTFKIEKIIKYRTLKGRREALIKWKYYSEKVNSWILASELKKYG
jgi:hypothetical protein